MGFTRALPRIADTRTTRAFAGLRESVRRKVTVYLAIASADAPSGAGYDDISGTPYQIDATDPYRTYTYRIIEVPARVRWNVTDQIAQEGLSGQVKLGDVTVYVGAGHTFWIDATIGDEHSYLTIDGRTVKVTNGPNPEGIGGIVEYSYELDQHTRTGRSSSEDGGILPTSVM